MREKHPERLDKLIEDLCADIQEGSQDGRGDCVRLWREYVREHAGLVFWLLLVMLLWGPLPLLLPLLGRYTVDNVIMITTYPNGIPDALLPQQVERLWFVVISGLAIMLLFAVFQMSNGWLSLQLAQRIVFRMRQHLRMKLQALHVGFFDQNQTGRIVTRILDDVTVIQQAVTNHVGSIVGCSSKLLVAMGILFWICWELALVVLASLPFYVLAYAVLQPAMRRNNIAMSRMNSRMYGRVMERLNAIKVIKSFATEREEYADFGHMNADDVRLGGRQMVYSHSLNIAAVVLQSVPSGTILLVGMWWVHDTLEGASGTPLTIGQLLAVIWMLPDIYSVVAQITNIATFSEQVVVRIRRVFSLLDENEGVRSGTRTLSGIRGAISFRDVTFYYPLQKEAALRNVTFTVRSGERIALMGPSGAGKSTIFQMLLRFYDPHAGEVYVGGIPLVEADVASVRRHIRMVQQEAFIFSGTIAENIAYGCPDATPAQIIRAARLAEMHDLIMGFPDRYETETGEQGTTLSGGQRQRLSLATALLTDPEILLLDDTTSALDAETEARIRTTLNQVMQNRTSLIITQRIATARSCDRIIVLENGMITQQGTHEQLYRQQGFYRRIYDQQASL